MTATTTAPLPASTALDEEIARAEVYGLLAQLFYAPPTSELLAALRAAATEAPAAGSYLETAWSALVGSARQRDDAAIAAEYEALFGGVGKPEVYLFASHYLAGFLNERPLAALRTALAALGLERDETMPETEDHIAYLCEVMRYLIAADDVAVANLTQQQTFFTAYLQPWTGALCDALAAHQRAAFYGALAAFARDFFSVEAQGFDMLA